MGRKLAGGLRTTPDNGASRREHLARRLSPKKRKGPGDPGSLDCDVPARFQCGDQARAGGSGTPKRSGVDYTKPSAL